MSDPSEAELTEAISAPRIAEPINLRTLVFLRWIAIAGQCVAVAVVWQMGIDFAHLPVVILILAAFSMNLWLYLQLPSVASVRRAVWQLTFDLVQISALLALTGGMSNPFSLLVLAPVTIAATSLNQRETLALAIATVILISLAGLLAVPLTGPDGLPLHLSPVLALGHWVALVIGVGFFALYAHRVTIEFTRKSDALFAAQVALLREQRLQHLGGVVAAAAHEMGTPLATIKLIAAELAEELRDRPDLHADALALRESADRCATIMRNMGRAGKDDLHMHSAPLRAVLEDAAAPHADRGPVVEIRAEGPDVRRDPAVIHAIRNLVQNAVDFAESKVVIESDVDARHLTITIRDDGPGYPPATLSRIGDPFLKSRRGGAQRKGYDGMGLGLFIAKTLLERSGATLGFANGGPGAIVTVRWPLERISANSRAALGQNPLQQP
jgi:two-component system sensor histidine kinase RegB